MFQKTFKQLYYSAHMNSMILSKTIFNFIQFRECMVVEIWIDGEADEFYYGEMVLSMN